MQLACGPKLCTFDAPIQPTEYALGARTTSRRARNPESEEQE